MSRWTPESSALLSLLLDDVTGTKEVVAIRQDFCRLEDCIGSNIMTRLKMYFTGSKAEGLDLPGSDIDYMNDLNNMYNIKVVQSLHESPAPSPYSVFYLCTDNTPPGFALLRCIKPGTSPITNIALENVNSQYYLSSSLMADNLFTTTKMYRFLNMPFCTKAARQGPSFEHWTIYDDPSGSGTDYVLSIHCAFWPNDASEWIERPRPSGWPTTHDVSSIVNFGCHLVAIGHPHSDTRSLEWRISFSVAERTLVWSFNHVQIQCYALMKIILKEFIKEKCNPDNQVVCSYFIKTFLFWKYEIKDLGFWQEYNLRECIKYLLIEFRQCLNEGVIRHFFFPRFNLLSVKMTAEAKIELLQLFDIIIQSDITILRECQTLKTVWSKFVSADGNQSTGSVIPNKHRRNFLVNEKVMMSMFTTLCSTTIFTAFNLIECVCDVLGPLLSTVFHQLNTSSSLHQLINQIVTLPCKTCLKSLLLKAFFFKSVILEKHFRAINTSSLGNRDVYGLLQLTAHDKSLSFDISTCKLWCAMFLLKKRDYTSTLRIVNQVLSSIPPYALYDSDPDDQNLTEAEHLYVDKFLHSESNVMERAREAWLCDLFVSKSQTKVMPLGIQIELYFCALGYPLLLSPFACLYYLQFLCYHKLHQYENRDRALRQLVVVANNDKQKEEFRHHSYNIAGHCLLIAGEIDQAREMFLHSYEYTLSLQNPVYEKLNSALWYLQNFC